MVREKSYRFEVISDVHIDLENNGKKIYFVYAEKNFRRALGIAKKRNCDFIVNVGDSVTNATGAKAEWQRYREIINESGYGGMIFETMGNHETRFVKYGGCTIEEAHREFIDGTRLKEKPVNRIAGKTYYAYTDQTFGDAFLFLSLENGVSTNEIDNFTDEQMDWAEEQLERFYHEGRRVFLIQHAPIDRFGVGDDIMEPAYGGSIRMTSQNGSAFLNNQRFLRLVKQYKDTIWLSGHTHVDLRDDVNYSNENENACHMIHVPSVAGTTRLSRDKNGKRVLDRSFYENASQGYIAEVFEDRAVFTGINIFDDRLYPQYQYIIRK